MYMYWFRCCTPTYSSWDAHVQLHSCDNGTLLAIDHVISIGLDYINILIEIHSSDSAEAKNLSTGIAHKI